MPEEVKAKALASVTKNLPNADDANSREFDKRVKIAELMLKEADIKNKSKIVELQMAKAKDSVVDMETEFLAELSGALKNGR